MKNYKSIFTSFLSICLFVGFNSFGQNLSSTDFQKKMIDLPNAPIIDVRTPNEFNQSHLKKAINIDINNDNFSNLINKLDKKKPVLIYCLSGSRSAYADKLMRSQGFKVIYNLMGGMIQWRAAGLPETTAKTTTNAEMSQVQFNKLLVTDKIVLVDFFAEWCKPCKVQTPIIKEIAGEMKDKVEIIMIDADNNKKIASLYQIKTIPTIMLFKNSKVIYSKQGAHTKSQLMKLLKDNL